MPRQPVMLVSVEKKEGIETPVGQFFQWGGKVIASTGTCDYLRGFGIEATKVSDFTGEPDWPGHEVVTIHPLIEGGLLVPDIPERHDFLRQRGGLFIDVLFNTLYYMDDALAAPDATPASVRQRTDVGGICLRHAAAKGGRAIATNIAHLNQIVDAMESGTLTDEMKDALCAYAEMECLVYQLGFTRFLSGGRYDGVLGERMFELGYGENPHQRPAYYSRTIGNDDPLAIHQFKLVEGIPPGYVNITDYDKAVYLLRKIASTFKVNRGSVPYIAAVLKHGNACGVGVDFHVADVALQRMIDGDHLSILGGIVITNFPIDDKLAETIAHYAMSSPKKRVLDGILAPGFSEGAIDAIKRAKTHKCRMFENADLASAELKPGWEFHPVVGGFLHQPVDVNVLDLNDPRMVKSAVCSREIEDDVLLAAAICGASDSNTTTLCKDLTLYANATGEKSRVFTIQKAGQIARDNGHATKGAAGCTDSFCPEIDGPEAFVALEPSLVFAPSGAEKDAKTFPVFHEAGVPVYSMDWKLIRMFHGH